MKKSFSILLPVVASIALSSCGHVLSAITLILQTDTNSIITPAELAANNENSPTSSLIQYAKFSTQIQKTFLPLQLWDMRLYHLSQDRNHNAALWQYVQQGLIAQCVTLVEQIRGLQVDSSTTVIDLMVQNDTFRGIVSGTIRGARTVRINPTGADTYEIVLEIDREMINYLLNTRRRVV